MRNFCSLVLVITACLITIWCTVVLYGCDLLIVQDEGLYTIDGVPVLPANLPMYVSLDPEMETENSEVQSLLNEAVLTWNSWMGCKVFDVIPASGDVSMSFGITPSLDTLDGFEDTFGMAMLQLDENNQVQYCEITISLGIAYHSDTVLITMEHELGHCLGFLDDPDSVDLQSIMSESPFEGCSLTESDKDTFLAAIAEE
jgi:hypothetical protein